MNRTKIKLGVITDEVSLDLREALQWAAEHHLDYVDLRDIYISGENIAELTDGQIDQIEALIGEYNLPVRTVCPPLFRALLAGEDVRRLLENPGLIDTDSSQYAEHLRLLRRSLELARRFKAPYVRTFAFFREKEPETVWSDLVEAFRLPLQLAGAAGKVLLLENEALSYAVSGGEAAGLIRTVGSGSLRAIWDPANAFGHPEPPYPDGYRALRPFIEIVHAKDADAEGFALLGQGRMDWTGQLQALVQDDFAGGVSIETHIITAGRKIIDESADNLAYLQQRLQ